MRSPILLFLSSLLYLPLCSGYNKNNKNNNNSVQTYVAPCENGIIQVTSMQILCDSPYTFYYGNGAHRNSPYCDYGDKATISMSFTVSADLDYDDVIYMTLGIYADSASEQRLYALRAVELCHNFVGDECIFAGDYSIEFGATFDSLYGDDKEFVPTVEIGFSTMADEGYNLGGVNIQCNFNNNNNVIDHWFNTDVKIKNRGSGSFGSNYGIILGAFALMVIFAVTMVNGLSERDEIQRQTTTTNPNQENLLAHEGDLNESSSSPHSPPTKPLPEGVAV